MSERAPSPDALLPALRRLLQPLIRLLIRSGITFPVLEDLLRTLYVEVAQQGLPPNDPGRSDSRISLRTGVHRKEIRRLRLEPEAPAFETPAVVTRSSRIIAAWLGEAAWRDADGTPMPLPRQGAVPSFEALVASVTVDVRPRAVLDEFLSQGVVRLDGEDRVVLNEAAFIPPPGQEAQIYYFARNLHDHIAAAAANIVAEGRAPHLDRAVHYDRLPQEVAVAFEAEARVRAQALLQELNALALDLLNRHEASRAHQAGVTRRVNLGIYVYTEDDPPAGEAAP